MRTVVAAGLAALLMAGTAEAATPRKPAPARPPAPPARAEAARAPGGSAANRRLEDIHIEGEIPVPQVLFVTARDQRRFLDFQHGRYLRTSRQLAEQTPVPSWIPVTATSPAKEPNR